MTRFSPKYFSLIRSALNREENNLQSSLLRSGILLCQEDRQEIRNNASLLSNAVRKANSHLYPGNDTTPEWQALCQSYQPKGLWMSAELEPSWDSDTSELNRPLTSQDIKQDTLPTNLQGAAIVAESPNLLLVKHQGRSFWIGKDTISAGVQNLEEDEIHLSVCEWTGEPRPAWAGKEKALEIESNWPTFAYITRLCKQYGYPRSCAVATLMQAHAPWMHPHSDKRKASAAPARDNEESNNRGSQEYIDPNHPYVPASPSRRTHRGGGFTKEQVTRAIARHQWSDDVSSALFEIVYARKGPKDVAERRNVPIKRLYDYSTIVRDEIRRPT